MDQYCRTICRGEPVKRIAKTFEDHLMKYQWTKEDRLSEDRQLLGELLCSKLCLCRRDMYSKNDQLNRLLKRFGNTGK